MSTKLYNFYKINEPSQVVFDKVNQLRKELFQHIGLNFQITFASYITKLVDDIFPSYEIKDKKNKDYEKIIVDILNESYVKNKTQKSGIFDIFEHSLVVYSYNNEIYIKTFFNCEFADRLFFSIFDKFEDFHYQNSTDKPDAISEKEWSNRKMIVNELFSTGKFSDSGLVADFRPELFEIKHSFGEKKEILKQVPNKKYRATAIAKKVIEREFFTKNKENFDTVSLFEKFRKSEEYKRELEDKYNKVINNLKEISEKSFNIEYRELH